MNQENPNYYAIIPANVRYDPDLRANEKLLYGEIVALSNKTGVCTASNNYFARLFNVKPSAISKWIKDLANKGYVNVEYEFEANSKEIKQRNIKLKVVTDINTVVTKDEGGYSQKDKENNTSINIKKDNIYKYILSKESFSFGEKIRAIIDYFNNCSEINSHYFKTTKKYKLTTKNKEALKLIKSRLRDGYDLDDFKDVIFIKYMDFVENEYQIEGKSSLRYYCPETLFALKHFSKYKHDYDVWSESND